MKMTLLVVAVGMLQSVVTMTNDVDTWMRAMTRTAMMWDSNGLAPMISQCVKVHDRRLIRKCTLDRRLIRKFTVDRRLIRKFTVDRRLIRKFTVDRRLIRKFIVDRPLIRKFAVDRGWGQQVA